MKQQDTFQKFLFEDLQIRGEIVRLNESYQSVLEKQAYPLALQSLLGESLAASTLLSGTLKFDGILSIQAKSKGPVNMLMTESTHDRKIRGIAQWEGNVPSGTLDQQLTQAQLAITITPAKGNRYQGVVPLESAKLSECLIHYFEQSEQLATYIYLYADEKTAAGVLIQKLPGNSSADEDAWDRIQHLTSTLKSEELTELANEEILNRLYHEENVTLYPEETVKFECSCSLERTKDALISLGEETVYDLLEQEKSITIDCQFCNEAYLFEKTDVDKLFGKNVLH